jgi:DeoR family glycerol-3-phosphate regulon repressor
MSINKRQLQIVQWVNAQGRQSVQVLASKFNVSVQTMRTDMRTLTERGLLLRSHGEAIPFPHRENISYNQRQIRNAAAKVHIAKLCCLQIVDYQSLFLGSGTTITELARLLHRFKGLQIMTTNIHAVSNLEEGEDCVLILSGGRVRQRDQDIIGGDAIRFFQRYRADVGIVSVGAVDHKGYLYDYNDDEIMAREALLAHCQYRVLLIDSTKFDSQSRCVSGNLADFDCVISDQKLSLKLTNMLLAKKISVLY